MGTKGRLQVLNVQVVAAALFNRNAIWLYQIGNVILHGVTLASMRTVTRMQKSVYNSGCIKVMTIDQNFFARRASCRQLIKFVGNGRTIWRNKM